MKQLLILIIFFTAGNCFSQTNRLDRYLIENTLYKKLKVKSILETTSTDSSHHYKKVYDMSGRLVSKYCVEDSVGTGYHFNRNADTLFVNSYRFKKGEQIDVFESERFVYNRLGKILTYQSCFKNYGSEKNIVDCELHKFFYDEKNILITELFYSNRITGQPFSTDLTIDERNLQLKDAYSYTYDRFNRLSVVKQVMGEQAYRMVDSFYYDEKSRLVKIISRQQQGFQGEMAVSNICKTRMIVYAKNFMTESNWMSHVDWEFKNIKTSGKMVTENTFYPDGLLKMRHYQQTSRPETALDSYYLYEFY